MIQDKGINDMRYGWRLENEWNKRVYRVWHNMIVRCYSEKYHEKYPTYKNCTVCKRWLYLSNFVEDFPKIDGYDEEKFLNGELCLDKDIKSNGKNKKYCLDNCILISRSENSKQANKTRDYISITGENNRLWDKGIKIAQYDKENLVRVWNSSHEIQRETGIKQTSIIVCCKFWAINCNKEEWFKTHKVRPCKKAGGFIWKYYKEGDINER